MAIFILVFNIFAAILNYYVWFDGQWVVNLYCSGVSTGVSIMFLAYMIKEAINAN